MRRIRRNFLCGLADGRMLRRHAVKFKVEQRAVHQRKAFRRSEIRHLLKQKIDVRFRDAVRSGFNRLSAGVEQGLCEWCGNSDAGTAKADSMRAAECRGNAFKCIAQCDRVRKLTESIPGVGTFFGILNNDCAVSRRADNHGKNFAAADVDYNTLFHSSSPNAESVAQKTVFGGVCHIFSTKTACVRTVHICMLIIAYMQYYAQHPGSDFA